MSLEREGLMVFWLVGLLAIAVLLFFARAGSGVPPTENPNANNPDAFEADLDPEGDEPGGY